MTIGARVFTFFPLPLSDSPPSRLLCHSWPGHSLVHHHETPVSNFIHE